MDADTFLATATVAEEAIGSRAVADHWSEPSALTGYTVGGLAGHLARAVLTVRRYLDQPAATGEPTDAAGYYVRVLASHDPLTSAFHTGVRERGEEEGADGPAAVATRMHDARQELADRLPALDAGRRLTVLDDTVLRLDDYLDTRLVELVLHLDDLAVSIGEDGAHELPPAAYATVAAILARIAVARAGPLATIRSLARRERHPDAVRAL